MLFIRAPFHLDGYHINLLRDVAREIGGAWLEILHPYKRGNISTVSR